MDSAPMAAPKTKKLHKMDVRQPNPPQIRTKKAEVKSVESKGSASRANEEIFPLSEDDLKEF